jgi:hypothetical protein
LISPLALCVDHHFTIFFGERALLRRGQDVQHQLGRAAQPGAQRGDDDGPVDEDGVRQHGVDQLRIGHARRVQPQFGEQGFLGAHDVDDGFARGSDQSLQRGAIGGVLRYSMTWGSAPLLRIMYRVLREVPHLGLW